MQKTTVYPSKQALDLLSSRKIDQLFGLLKMYSFFLILNFTYNLGKFVQGACLKYFGPYFFIILHTTGWSIPSDFIFKYTF